MLPGLLWWSPLHASQRFRCSSLWYEMHLIWTLSLLCIEKTVCPFISHPWSIEDLPWWIIQFRAELCFLPVILKCPNHIFHWFLSVSSIDYLCLFCGRQELFLLLSQMTNMHWCMVFYSLSKSDINGQIHLTLKQHDMQSEWNSIRRWMPQALKWNSHDLLTGSLLI